MANRLSGIGSRNFCLDDYETFTADSGQKGLEIFHRVEPDVSVVDIRVPGMDGIEALKRIKWKWHAK